MEENILAVKEFLLTENITSVIQECYNPYNTHKLVTSNSVFKINNNFITKKGIDSPFLLLNINLILL